jgi:predicted RNA-binding protein
MCLAKAYVRASASDSEGKLIMENVTRVEVNGDMVHLASLLGESENLKARISGVSFADARLVLETTE